MMRKLSLLLLLPLMAMGMQACHPGKPSKPLMGGNITTEKMKEKVDAEVADATAEAAETTERRPKGKRSIDFLTIESADDVVVLQRKGYCAWYSEVLRVPVAVAWHLTADHTSGAYKRKGTAFREDVEVSSSATTYDYMQSGYDRGHMCPSGDNKWDAEAQQQSFLLTNVCPQNHQLNAGDWNELEQRCRTWARRYGDIYIVCGPVFRHAGSKPKTIGRNKVAVPDGFYKVVVRVAGNNAAGLAFVYENNSSSQPMSQAVCTIDEVEALTGINFFPFLSQQQEQRVEAQSSLSDW